MTPRPLPGLAQDDGGGAAVEFAVVVPVIAAILGALVLAWSDIAQMSQMRSAVHAGADYARRGGSEPTLVRTVVERSWEEMPENSTVTVTESCSCGTVASGCAVLCPSNRPPSIYLEIRATTGDPDQLIGRSAAEVVRVR